MPKKGEKRAPHKPECKCVVCQKAREKVTPAPVVAPVISEPPPSEVRLDSLPITALFQLNDQRYRVAIKEPDCIVCHRLSFRSTGPLKTDNMWRVVGQVTLATFTMVKPIR